MADVLTSVTYWPFDYLPDGSTQQEVTEDQGSLLFGAAIGDGVQAAPGDDDMQVASATGATQVSVAPGLACVQGFACQISGDPALLDVDGADSADRLDRIVVRLDKDGNTCQPHVVKGTAGSVSPPAFTRNATTHDLSLAVVKRSSGGALTITNSQDYEAVPIHVQRSDNRSSSVGGYGFGYDADTDSLLRWDGTSWKALTSDSGWAAIPQSNTFWVPLATSLHPTHVRTLNGVTYLNAYFQRGVTTWGAGDANSGVAYLPAAHRPSDTVSAVARVGTGRCNILIQPDGQIQASYPDHEVTTSAFLYLTMSWAR